MQAPSLLRIGAICSYAYVALWIATQIYVGNQHFPTTTKGMSTDQVDKTFLTFVHLHQDVFAITVVAALAGYVLLSGVAIALFRALTRPGLRIAKIALYLAFAGLLVSIVGEIIGISALINHAQQLADAHNQAAITSALKSYNDGTSRDQLIAVAGNFALAFWIGLIGASLLRIHGNRNIPGWASVGACLLQGLGLPVIVAWCAGAGLGLWRLAGDGSVAAMATAAEEVEPVNWAPEPEPLTRRMVTRSPEPAVTAPPPAEVGRQPRGTSVPRRMPAHAAGSKAARPRKRR